MNISRFNNGATPPRRNPVATMARSSFIGSPSYPLELHYIKALFLQKQYRQCIQACRNLLKTAGNDDERPAQQMFINFYLGLAHDELARLMHDHSQAKLPSFNQAEQFYNDALQSLPAVTAAHKKVQEVQELDEDDEEDPFFNSSPPAFSPPQASDSSADDYDPFNYSSPSYPQMPPMSPPTHIRTDSLPIRSPQAASRETSSSDLDSHASFEQIMTPHKVLQRDVSRMSLLDDIPKRPVQNFSLPRTTSTVQGLLRPINPGSPPRAFHVPPRLPYASSVPGMNSRLPKLVTRNMQDSPSKATSAMRQEWDVPASPPPVSPLGSEGAASDASTISPISPETPMRDGDFSNAQTPASLPDQATPERDLMSEHIEAMRVQIETHLSLLSAAKERTISAQSTRAAERASAAPTRGTPLAPLRASLDSTASISRPGSSSSSKHDSVLSSPDGSAPKRGKKMVTSSSYWSFTPANVKAQELQKRVERGRERNWERQRFRPERYWELAEKALAEL